MLRGDLPCSDRLALRVVTTRGRFRADHLARNLGDVVGGLRSWRLLVDEPAERERVAHGAILLERWLEQAGTEQVAQRRERAPIRGPARVEAVDDVSAVSAVP
jgi:hypothetical protein